MDLDEIKKLLEEMYEMRLRWNELEPGENPYEVVEVIEEIYSNIFGSDEFDEFIKRKEDEEEQIKRDLVEKILGDSIKPLDYENNDDYEREEQEKLREEQENWEYEETQRFKQEREKMEEEQEFLKRFDSGETFDEEELREIVKEEIFDIVDTQLDNELHRWTRTVTTVFEIKGRLFALEWEQGLTEECDDEFYNQPYEVEKEVLDMELDKRIKDGRRPLSCIDTGEAIQFIEMRGYFANDLVAFRYLGFTDYTQRFTTLSYGTLKEVDNDGEKAFSDEIAHKFNYFLPEEWVEPEKKYRPYTLDEWRRTHALGTEVVFRKKRKVTGTSRPVLHRMFLGYDEGKHYLEKIHLGYSAFTLETLFEKYEIYEDGTWRPFGVNCKLDNPVSNKTILEAINKVKC